MPVQYSGLLSWGMLLWKATVMVRVPVPDTLSGMASDRLSSGVQLYTTRVSSWDTTVSSASVTAALTP